jgi:hypothetical protein
MLPQKDGGSTAVSGTSENLHSGEERVERDLTWKQQIILDLKPSSKRET